MNPPLSAAAPTRPARARTVDALDLEAEIDIDLGVDDRPYRPAHAAHARVVDDAAIVDLTTNDGHPDVEIVVIPDEAPIGETSTDRRPSDDANKAHEAVEPLIGARAAARAGRRRASRSAGQATDTGDAVTWTAAPRDITPSPVVPTPTLTTVDASTVDTLPSQPAEVTANDTLPADTPMVAAERDPLGLIRAVESAWTAITCWARRNATVQLVVPFLFVVTLGLFVVIATGGATQRIGQIVVTAALVTAGVAWAQAIGDQRRRQHDLRFRLASGNLERADLTGTVLDGFTLWGQNLRGAKLSGCSADHVLLSGADLREASLTGASLRVASLAGADLSKARLYRSDLRGADLTDAIAVSTSFDGAVLRGALLEGADLSGADLSGADLRGATHDDRTCWNDIVVTEDTHLPDDVPVLQP